ncbi:MAG: chemotaxis protein CheB [Oscillospiraceae bacterium]|nr:chemotaxis protein CheB [Oscillospiraceae bacterium]
MLNILAVTSSGRLIEQLMLLEKDNPYFFHDVPNTEQGLGFITRRTPAACIIDDTAIRTGISSAEFLAALELLRVPALLVGTSLMSRTAAAANGFDAYITFGFPDDKEFPAALNEQLKRLIVPYCTGTAADSPVYSQGGVEVIAIGASTGGTDAIEAVLQALDESCPPVIITQHMPPGFTSMYAKRLDKTTPLRVSEASDGMYIGRGQAVVAMGGRHMELHRDREGYYVTSRSGCKVSGHCPSVDVMFQSAALCAGSHAAGVLLTGMGYDGAHGMLMMKKRGAYTICQDKETSAVFGMPMEAQRIGAACDVCPLDGIGAALRQRMRGDVF